MGQRVATKTGGGSCPLSSRLLGRMFGSDLITLELGVSRGACLRSWFLASLFGLGSPGPNSLLLISRRYGWESVGAWSRLASLALVSLGFLGCWVRLRLGWLELGSFQGTMRPGSFRGTGGSEIGGSRT